MKSLSPVQLLATPGTAAYQAPQPMGFSRQEYWNGLPLPSPHKEQPSFNFMDAVTICSDFGAQENKVILEENGTPLQYSCLKDPMDGGAW